MNPYLFTITFLMLMGLITSSEVRRFQSASLEHRCFQAACTTQLAAEELRELSHFETTRGKRIKSDQKDEVEPEEEKGETPKRSSPKYVRALGVNAARPPNNSRLNLYMLLVREPSPSLPKEFSLYETAARMIRSLYGNEPFFSEFPSAEYRVLDRLIEKRELMAHFTSPDALCELDLEDEMAQTLLHNMLKGTKTSPSLLNYITFDPIDSTGQNRKINLMFADPVIIRAIFPEGDTASELLAARDKIWSAIEYQETHRKELAPQECKGRTLFKKELYDALTEILDRNGFKSDKYRQQVFDCTLSKPGSIIFLENNATGHLIRQKYSPPTPPSP